MTANFPSASFDELRCFCISSHLEPKGLSFAASGGVAVFNKSDFALIILPVFIKFSRNITKRTMAADMPSILRLFKMLAIKVPEYSLFKEPKSILKSKEPILNSDRLYIDAKALDTVSIILNFKF